MDLNTLNSDNRRWTGIYAEDFEVSLEFDSAVVSVAGDLPGTTAFDDVGQTLAGNVTAAPSGDYFPLTLSFATGPDIEIQLWFFAAIALTFDPIPEETTELDLSETDSEAVPVYSGFRSQPILVPLYPLLNKEIEREGNLYYVDRKRTIVAAEIVPGFHLPPGLVYDAVEHTISGIPRATGLWQCRIRLHYEDVNITSTIYGIGNEIMSGGTYDMLLSFNFGLESQIAVTERATLGSLGTEGERGIGIGRGLPDGVSARTNFHPSSLSVIVFDDEEFELGFYGFPHGVRLYGYDGYNDATKKAFEESEDDGSGIDWSWNQWPAGTIFYPDEASNPLGIQTLEGALPAGGYVFAVQADWEDAKRGYSVFFMKILSLPGSYRPWETDWDALIAAGGIDYGVWPEYFDREDDFAPLGDFEAAKEPTLYVYDGIGGEVVIDYGGSIVPWNVLRQIHRMDISDLANPQFTDEIEGEGFNRYAPVTPFIWWPYKRFYITGGRDELDAEIAVLDGQGIANRERVVDADTIILEQRKDWTSPHSPTDVTESEYLATNIRTISFRPDPDVTHYSGEVFDELPVGSVDTDDNKTGTITIPVSALEALDEEDDGKRINLIFEVESTVDWVAVTAPDTNDMGEDFEVNKRNRIYEKFDLSSLGLPLGTTVTVSNFEAKGDFPDEDAGFTITLNPRGDNETEPGFQIFGAYTGQPDDGQFYAVTVDDAQPLSSTVELVDISSNGAGTPGIILESELWEPASTFDIRFDVDAAGAYWDVEFDSAGGPFLRIEDWDTSVVIPEESLVISAIKVKGDFSDPARTFDLNLVYSTVEFTGLNNGNIPGDGFVEIAAGDVDSGGVLAGNSFKHTLDAESPYYDVPTSTETDKVVVYEYSSSDEGPVTFRFLHGEPSTTTLSATGTVVNDQHWFGDLTGDLSSGQDASGLFYLNPSVIHDVKHKSYARVEIALIDPPESEEDLDLPADEDPLLFDRSGLTPFNYTLPRRLCGSNLDLDPAGLNQPQAFNFISGATGIGHPFEVDRPLDIIIETLLSAHWRTKEFEFTASFNLITGSLDGNLDVDIIDTIANREIRNHPDDSNSVPTTIEDSLKSHRMYVSETDYVLEWLGRYGAEHLNRNPGQVSAEGLHQPLFKLEITLTGPDSNIYTITTQRPAEGVGAGSDMYEITLPLNFMGTNLPLYATRGAHYLNGVITIAEKTSWFPEA